MTFLAGLGTLVRLRDCPPAEIYTGGLDRNGADGEYAYSWQDDICQGTSISAMQPKHLRESSVQPKIFGISP